VLLTASFKTPWSSIGEKSILSWLESRIAIAIGVAVAKEITVELEECRPGTGNPMDWAPLWEETRRGGEGRSRRRSE
jgi:hypothetical protein